MPSQDEPNFDPQFDRAVLEGVNHQHCAQLTRVFDIMADKLGGVSNETALWAITTLLAKVMVAASDREGAYAATTERFAAMLRVAYPVMVKAMEEVTRKADGRPPYDA